MKKLFFLIFFIWIANAHAQMSGAMPENIMPGVERGKLEGVLVEKNKKSEKPMAGEPVALMVFQNGQRILMLDKKTDDKGRFLFRNIFKDSSFVYALGYMRDQELYVMTDLKILPGGNDLNVKFVVGEGSPYRVSEELMNQAATASSTGDLGMNTSASGKASFSATGKWAKSYKTLSLILCGLVGLMAFYFIARRD